MLVIDKLRELYPNYKIEATCNEDGYSDIEIIIDNELTEIWTDDYFLYAEYDENECFHQFILDDVEEYIKNKENERIRN